MFLTNNTTLPAPVIAQLYQNRRQVELFVKWIKQNLHIKKVLGYQRVWGEDANLVRHRHLGVDRHCQKGTATEILAQHLSADVVSLGFRDNPGFMRLAGQRATKPTRSISNQLILFDF